MEIDLKEPENVIKAIRLLIKHGREGGKQFISFKLLDELTNKVKIYED